MTDLHAAILERIDQLEALAREAGRDRTPPWTADTDPEDPHVTARMQLVPDPITVTDAATASIALHVATWEPQAVLTLTAGAREAVERHGPHPSEPTSCNHCTELLDAYAPFQPLPCDTIHTIARMLGIDPDGT